MQNINNEIENLSVRSLRILKYLLESKSVSLTAEYVGLSQPATSRIVAKLRNITKDPLLVRTSKGYDLTPFAIQLYPKLVLSLESIAGVFEADALDLSKVDTTLRIASTDYGVVSVLSHLYPILLKHAPGLKLQVNNFTPSAFQEMEQGSLDLALFADFDIPGDFHYRRLFEETYSVILRDKHPLVASRKYQQGVTQEQLAQWPMAKMMYPSTKLMQQDNVIESVNQPADSTFSLPYFLAIAPLIENTDSVIALPTKMAQHIENHYQITAIPLQPQSSFSYVAIWHHRQHQRPLLRWVVDQLAKI